MTPATEPLSLRLPRDLLVLQPMQGHLDLEPVLLAPGLRCVIGAAESCAVRLTKSALVQPEHCVVEVIGRQTMLTEWEAESTWLNDRLVTEPTELVPGDRISVGPFDFRVRPASADELLYAKLIDRDSGQGNNVEDVLRLKRALDNSSLNAPVALASSPREPALDMFGELLRETKDSSDADGHERLTQHISKLLGDLQSQVLALQEKESELNEQLRSQRESPGNSRSGSEAPTVAAVARHSQPAANSPALPMDAMPAAVQPDYEQVLQLLKAERDQLDKDRSQLADEQALWREQQQDWSQRLQTLETQLAEIEAQRQAVLEERDICRSLATELMRDEAKMKDREEQLKREEQELATLRIELNRREQELADPKNHVSISKTMPFASTVLRPIERIPPVSTEWSNDPQSSSESDALVSTGRPVQTLLSLVAFGLSALLLSGSFGDREIMSTLGWGTATLGGLSTVDLVLRRWISSQR